MPQSARFIVPENFQFPENNIIAYDGVEPSVFAIKQFAYLFPGLYNETLLMNLSKRSGEVVPEKEYMEELWAHS